MALAVAVAAFTAIFSYLGIARHESTFSHDWRDEAYTNQMMWNTARGDLLFSTVEGPRRHDRHFRPSFFPASIAYIPIRSAWAWYIEVALAVGVGAFAARRLGLLLFQDHAAALLAGAAWLAWPAVHDITLGNLDIETFVAAAWLFAAVFYVERRYLPFFATAIFAISCKETQAPVLCAFGALALLDRRPARWWAAPILVGAVWFFVALKIIIPIYHPSWGTIFGRFIGSADLNFPASFFRAFAADPAGVLAQVFSREHIELFYRIGRPLLFLFLLSPLPIVGAGTIVIQILLQHDPLPVRQAHMISAILPFVFWAFLRGVRRLGELGGRVRVLAGRERGVAVGALAAANLCCAALWFAPGTFGLYQNYGLDRIHGMTASNVLDRQFRTPTSAELRARRMADRVPENVVAMANARLLLVMSSRPNLMEFGTQKSLEDFAPAQAVFIWFLRTDCRTCTFAELSPQNLRLAGRLVSEGRFGVAHLDGAFAVLTNRRLPATGFAPDESLSLPFIGRVEEIAGALARGEGLPLDEPRDPDFAPEPQGGGAGAPGPGPAAPPNPDNAGFGDGDVEKPPE
ncbi:DUF2079 domain-containing protein [bacterium]|nr:DUF2079 domain-containing protein [bacterium]